MSVKDFVVILCLCSFQVCDSAECKLYDNSDIKWHCQELEIVEHGSVCYTLIYVSQDNSYFWEANFTCKDGFHLVNTGRHTCYYPSRSEWVWRKPTVQSNCVPDEYSTEKSPSSSTTTTETVFDDNSNDNRDHNLDNQDESLPVEYVIVPIVIVLLIALLVIISVVIYRKRKVSGNSGPNCQNGSESRVANRAYYHPVDNTETNDNKDSEYVYIADSEIKPNTTDESEYNTLHENALSNNSQNYHHIPVQPDTYAHTTSSCSNVQSDTDTYSHVYNANHGKGRSGLNTEMGNIYNKLQVDDQNKMKDFDSTGVDPDYDHANIRSDVPASIELDTYSHVTNGLDKDLS